MVAVALDALVRDTVELLRSEFLLQGVSLKLELAAAASVLGNAVQLQQVLINMMLNAADAMAVRPPAERLLLVRSRSEAGQVRLELTDNGPRLSADVLLRLGDPFFTTKRNGMGMGLAISRSILEAHGGGFRAENNQDRGATFHVVLPTVPA